MNVKGAKVVARYADGRLIKGYTFDFQPERQRFHVFSEPTASRPAKVVMLSELKAVFFVRDLVGNPHYQERKQFVDSDAPTDRRVEVSFVDGEVLVGVAERAEPGSPGIFLVPVDERSNNLKVYAVPSATRRVRVLPAAPKAAARLRPEPGRQVSASRPRPALPVRFYAWLLEGRAH